MVLRRPYRNRRWLQIGAVCIDQRDDDGKANQIASMFIIYQRAK